ncbi:glycosyltransferase family 2 protein [Radiobacillus kanasensis]|uniref:glycosyltransferase family 2 protein n=1 Tax=Radiobacillus kanasensis TaxID=2844358 RepID=UPI001E34281D|nr:glycosyltransferase family A protein [Radiobacillus kanasensis]UFT99177.1 glycosyltransferase family 2 protein [Radiobacillus kanasensis]
MVEPVVSVIIPTFNRVHALAELMEALSSQTFKYFEIVIVNDAGEDVTDVQELYPELPITIINLPGNRGHVYARNVGVGHARGEFILLIDDDDLIVSTHMETMLQEVGGFELVFSDVEIVDYELENGTRKVISRFPFAYNWDRQAMRTFSTFVPSGTLYRKEIHSVIGNFDEEMKHYWDWDFFLRVEAQFRVKKVPIAGVLYEFSQTGNNASKNQASMRIHLDRLSLKHHLGELPTKNFFLLLEEPELLARKSDTKIVWDGQPFVSRMDRKETV